MCVTTFHESVNVKVIESDTSNMNSPPSPPHRPHPFIASFRGNSNSNPDIPPPLPVVKAIKVQKRFVDVVFDDQSDLLGNNCTERVSPQIQ